jgi:tetratricopeptide (TPR) repeat protein
MKNYLLPTALLGTIALISYVSPAVALSPVEIQRIARQTTVQITGCDFGSGVIIRKDGNIYSVLTVAHNFQKSGCEIVTADDTKHQTSKAKLFPNKVDLAVVTFTSSKNYPIAKLIDNSDRVEATETIYVSGFPLSTAINTSVFSIVKGDVVANPPNKQQGKGYSLIYSNNTLPGYSGGPVWNELGELIAIHGQGDIDTKLQTTVNDNVRVKTGYNLGITINTFAKLATAAGVSGYTPTKVATVKPKPVEDLLASALLEESKGNYQGMLANADRAIAIDANNARLYYVRGVAKFQLSDRQGALSDYNKSIALNPKFAQAQSNRAYVRAELGDTKGAMEDSNRAISLDPNLPEAYVNRSLAKFQLGDNRGVIEDATRAIALKPNFAQAYSNRALAKSELGDDKGAIEDANRAISINPKLAEAILNRGLAKFKLGEYRVAIEDFNRAIALKPSLVQAYSNIGAAKLALGDNKGSIEECNRALALNPNLAEGYFVRGFAKYQLGDNQGAISDASRAISLKPNFAQAYANRGVAKLALGDKKTAIEDLRKSATLFKQQGKMADYQRIVTAMEQIGS